jgi:hypothetical protein
MTLGQQPQNSGMVISANLDKIVSTQCRNRD